MEEFVFASNLLPADHIVLQQLVDDVRRHRDAQDAEKLGKLSDVSDAARQESETRYDSDLRLLGDLNDPSASRFEPNVFATVDMRNISTKSTFYRFFLKHYMSWAKSIVRHETDIIMLTHLILYFTTALPSAIWLFCRPSYLRGVLHFAMQFQYMGSYTLMMHQHIHMRGILARKPFISWFDKLFPYVMDPLMGHTWNTYYYHHVKHHHIEGNGPDDLSSTVRYQRDDIFHLMHYIGRFFLLVWLDLPLYFIRKGRPSLGLKVAAWEITNYAILYATFQLNRTACCFVFLLPLLFTRLGLMIGNWGQHAFVDADDPESEYRSSITLIDVASNRFCYNDGYHTSHHLNSRHHWREHPVHFLRQKGVYAKEKALVFHNIDYIMITISLVLKRYDHLARCLVPIGDQIDLTMEERVAMLKRNTRRFTEEELCQKFSGYRKR